MNPLIAVDIGNSAIKFAYFPSASEAPLPEATWVDVQNGNDEAIFAKLDTVETNWWIAGVHRGKEKQLVDAIRCARPQDRVHSLGHDHAELAIGVAQPERLGEDRIFAAVAANAIREPGQSAIVVDTGSAITIDAIDASGMFLGGAILPGLAMGVRSLHRDTDALPEVKLGESLPPMIGKDTVSAIQSGIIHGAAGAIRYFAESLRRDSSRPPLCIISGGDARRLVPILGDHWRQLPHLVVQGVALTARRLQD